MPTTNKWIRLHKYRTQWHQWSALWTYATQERIIALHVQTTNQPANQPRSYHPHLKALTHTGKQRFASKMCVPFVWLSGLIQMRLWSKKASTIWAKTKKKYMKKLNLKKKLYTTMYLHWKSVYHLLMRQCAIVCVRNSLRIMRTKGTHSLHKIAFSWVSICEIIFIIYARYVQ